MFCAPSSVWRVIRVANARPITHASYYHNELRLQGIMFIEGSFAEDTEGRRAIRRLPMLHVIMFEMLLVVVFFLALACREHKESISIFPLCFSQATIEAADVLRPVCLLKGIVNELIQR